MTPNDFNEFRKIVAGIHAYYRQDLSDFVLSIFWDGLKEYDIQAVSNAFRQHTQNTDDAGKFCPKVADIKKMISGGTQDRALSAWSKVDRAIRCVGTYESVVFDDALIHRVLQDMGGWVSLGTKSED